MFLAGFVLSSGSVGEYVIPSFGINKAVRVLFCFVCFYCLKSRNDLKYKELYISTKVGKAWCSSVSILTTGEHLFGRQVATSVSADQKVCCEHICSC